MDASVGATTQRPYNVIGLIGGAHAISHFFQLAVPVVFPLMKDSLGVSYGELGLVATLFYIASGLAQFASGFLVDHFGARRILFIGIALLAGSVLLCGLVSSYAFLIVLMPIAGIGNSVFHPADYAILNASVKEAWLGRAFGVHTLGGNIGWALAPIIVLSLASQMGWRWALVAVGAAGLAVLGALMTQGSHLGDGHATHHERRASQTRIPLRDLVLAPAILLCFIYFTLLAVTIAGIQNFLPTILIVEGFTLSVGTTALTAFLIASSAGTVLGAVLADRTGRNDWIVAAGLATAGTFIVVVSYLSAAAPIIAALAVAGFCFGSAMPSRDMIVRQATPRGATGRVFGFVYSGLDAGSAIAPVTVGLLLDHHQPRLALWLLAAALFLAIATTSVIVRFSRSPVEA